MQPLYHGRLAAVVVSRWDFIWSQRNQLHVLFSVHKGLVFWSVMILVAIASEPRDDGSQRPTFWLSSRPRQSYMAPGIPGILPGTESPGVCRATPLRLVLCIGAAFSCFALVPRVAVDATSSLAILICLGLMRAYGAGNISFYGASASDYLKSGLGTEFCPSHYLKAWFGR